MAGGEHLESGRGAPPSPWPGLEALDKEDPTAIDPAYLDPVESSKVHAEVLEFVREAIFVVAREIDQLRAAGTNPDELS